MSSTIKKYAYCSIASTSEDGFPVNSMGCTTEVGNSYGDSLSANGDADFARAVMKRVGVAEKLAIVTSSDCPPGSGMGSSSAIVVAIIGGFCAWSSREMRPKEIADMAYQIERHDVGIPGGMQDQYAAAIGGFNLIRFEKDMVKIDPLSVSKPIKNELEYRLLLCSTGTTRPSGGILSRQINSYKEKNPLVMDALHEIKKLTLELHRELVSGRVEEFGELLGQEWELKKKLDPAISNDEVDRLYHTALKNGAVGGKLLGAGGGGYLLLFARDESQKKLASAVIKAGSRVENVRFEESGVESWKLESSQDKASDRAGLRSHLNETSALPHRT